MTSDRRFCVILDPGGKPGQPCSGRLVRGVLRPGDAVRLLPSGFVTRVRSVDDGARPVDVAAAGTRVRVMLEQAAGDGPVQVLAAVDDPPQLADQFEAHLTWRGPEPLLPERSYRMRRLGTDTELRVTAIKYRLDPAGGSARLAARTLRNGETGIVNIWTGDLIVFDPRERGGEFHRFLACEPATGEVLAEGEIEFALRRASNIHLQSVAVDKTARAHLKGQRPCCIWLTGLSGAGKSTIANRLEQRLLEQGRHTYLLDGDNVRHGLCRDLGFTEADRVENIRRVTEVARLLVDAGLIVIVSFISPFRAERRQARAMLGRNEYLEVFVDTPLEVCERRDPKGLYAKARRGQLPNFTGIDSPYEPPEDPDLHLRAAEESVDHCVDKVLDAIAQLSASAIGAGS